MPVIKMGERRGQSERRIVVLLLPLAATSSAAGGGSLVSYKLTATPSSASPPSPTSNYSFNEEQESSCDSTMASWENGLEERDVGGYSYSEEPYEQPYSPAASTK